MLAWFMTMALAQEALTFGARTVVEHGVQAPALIITPNVAGSVEVSASCGGKTWTFAEVITPGRDVEFAFDGIAEGTHACAIEIAMQGADGSDGAITMPLQVSSLPIVKLSSSIEQVDLELGKATLQASRPVTEVQVTAIGAKGVTIDQAVGDVGDGTHLTVTWRPQGQTVVKLWVDVKDQHGFGSRLELLPWSYAIPHEDVIFASGSDQIAGDEAPKLETCWGEVAKTLDLYGEVVPIELYVTGYTDTVGDAGSNRALSERRARSISRWFRQRGFTGPIRYQGFGEDVLAVVTGDDVDEASNRRAMYVLAAQQPPISEQIPKDRWKKL